MTRRKANLRQSSPASQQGRSPGMSRKCDKNQELIDRSHQVTLKVYRERRTEGSAAKQVVAVNGNVSSMS
jgi:hypothetical protein